MARLVYSHPGTPIRFNPFGASSSGEVGFSSLLNLLPGSGAISDPRDFGPSSRPIQYTWRARHKMTVVSSYDSVNYYLVTSDDGVWWDANIGSGNRQLGNLQTAARDMQNVGSVTSNIDGITPSGTTTTIITSGMVNIVSRYAAVVAWNDTLSALTSANGDHEFTLIPLPDEVQ